MLEGIGTQFSKALFVVNSNAEIPQKSFEKAMRLSSLSNTHLDIICVLPDLAPLNYSHSNEMLQRIEQASLESVLKKLNQSIEMNYPDFSGQVHIRFGKEFVEVIRYVVNQGYDLVIKQAENKHWLQSVFGSNDLHFLRKCPCAVWMIEKDAPEIYKNIGLSIDFSDDEVEQDLNHKLALYARQFSELYASNLHLITAFDAGLASFAGAWADNAEEFESSYLRDESNRRQFEAKYLLDSLRAPNPEQGAVQHEGIEYRSHVINGHPQQVIPNIVLQHNIDLLVMGTVARSGLMGVLIGNTAEAILLQVKCSLFSAKPKGFECPISV